MVLTTVHLFFIMLAFVLIIVWLVIFFYRYKFQIAGRLAKELGFRFYAHEKDIPLEYKKLGEKLRNFKFFEWIIVGEVQGKKVFIVQYFINRPSQFPFHFAVFSLFEKEISLREREEEGFSITESGVFSYPSIPWILKKEAVVSVLQKIVEVRKKIES